MIVILKQRVGNLCMFTSVMWYFLPPMVLLICKRGLFNRLKQTGAYIKILKNIIETNPTAFQDHVIWENI